MTRYRNALPQLRGDLFLTDGGIETTLIFHSGLDLPHFAAFHLLQDETGTAALRKYFLTYAGLAKEFRSGLILESATWRASADWGRKLGYTDAGLAAANTKAIRMLEDIRKDCEAAGVTTVVSGCVGPRGDGYVPSDMMSADEAREYHRDQIETFAGTAADMVCAITMNYPEEAIGVSKAAGAVEMPVAISFTVETDGRLPTGQTLGAAIESVDDATGGLPSYYMINCAHPTHFDRVLADGGKFVQRIRGLRANASSMSHAELNEAPALDAGDPAELGAQYAALKASISSLNILGGCCGTDHRHVGAIASACVPLFAKIDKR
jgi:S-methylmethionine-dependent homocysteine/selenocysteine methylase